MVFINELKSYPAIKLINKAPWHYFDKAMDAANRVFSYETKNMPDLNNYLKSKTFVRHTPGLKRLEGK